MTRELRGNFVVWHNRDKQRGDTLPLFTGRIASPTLKADHHTALWGYRDRNKLIYLSGLVNEVPIGAEPTAHMDALIEPPVYDIDDIVTAGHSLTLKPNEIVLFTNVRRVGRQPHYWGRTLMGGVLLEIGAWLKTDRRNKPMLSGATSRPRPMVAKSSISELTDQVADFIPARPGPQLAD